MHARSDLHAAQLACRPLEAVRDRARATIQRHADVRPELRDGERDFAPAEAHGGEVQRRADVRLVPRVGESQLEDGDEQLAGKAPDGGESGAAEGNGVLDALGLAGIDRTGGISWRVYLGSAQNVEEVLDARSVCGSGDVAGAEELDTRVLWELLQAGFDVERGKRHG